MDIDEANFGITRARAVQIVQMQLDWWKRQFALAETVFDDHGVGKQRFLIGACDDTTDLRVQFGTLTPEQMRDWPKYVVGRPNSFVGVAVRTHYDTVNMRGKGFVYLSPQSGPLQVEWNPGQLRRPWSVLDGTLAGAVLTHEFGHVFGYVDGSLRLMSERVPEALLREGNLNKLRKDLLWPDLFLWSKSERIVCIGDDNDEMGGRRYLALPTGPMCLGVTLSRDELRVSVTRDRGKTWKLHARGKVSFNSRSSNHVDRLIFLPNGQTVFVGEGKERYLLLPAPCDEAGEVVLTTLDGSVTRNLRVEVSPSSSDRIIGTLDERVVSDVFSDLFDRSGSDSWPEPVPTASPSSPARSSRRSANRTQGDSDSLMRQLFTAPR